jgi:hypothetical protein
MAHHGELWKRELQCCEKCLDLRCTVRAPTRRPTPGRAVDGKQAADCDSKALGIFYLNKPTAQAKHCDYAASRSTRYTYIWKSVPVTSPGRAPSCTSSRLSSSPWRAMGRGTAFAWQRSYPLGMEAQTPEVVITGCWVHAGALSLAVNGAAASNKTCAARRSAVGHRRSDGRRRHGQTQVPAAPALDADIAVTAAVLAMSQTLTVRSFVPQPGNRRASTQYCRRKAEVCAGIDDLLATPCSRDDVQALASRCRGQQCQWQCGVLPNAVHGLTRCRTAHAPAGVVQPAGLPARMSATADTHLPSGTNLLILRSMPTAGWFLTMPLHNALHVSATRGIEEEQGHLGGPLLAARRQRMFCRRVTSWWAHSVPPVAGSTSSVLARHATRYRWPMRFWAA